MPYIDYSNSSKTAELANAPADGINTVYINGRAFSGVGEDSKLGWYETAYVSEPSRSLNFSLPGIDNIAMGKVARCELNYKYMNMEDYRQLKFALDQRYFMVKFYDVDSNKWVEREMYCSGKDRERFYHKGTELIGVVNVPITFVGTNNDVDEGETVILNIKSWTDTDLDPIVVAKGTQVTLPSEYGTGQFHDFHYEYTSPSRDFLYKPGQKITMWENTSLKMIVNPVPNQ